MREKDGEESERERESETIWKNHAITLIMPN